METRNYFVEMCYTNLARGLTPTKQQRNKKKRNKSFVGFVSRLKVISPSRINQKPSSKALAASQIS